jgi:hypothetical protein
MPMIRARQAASNGGAEPDTADGIRLEAAGEKGARMIGLEWLGATVAAFGTGFWTDEREQMEWSPDVAV